jgi:uncharacterized protein
VPQRGRTQSAARPDVYLGVADVTAPDGIVCDHVVVMRRVPNDRRLSTLVRQHADVTNALRRVAYLVAAFHSRSERNAQLSRPGSRDELRNRWSAAFDQLRLFHGRDPALRPRGSASVSGHPTTTAHPMS